MMQKIFLSSTGSGNLSMTITGVIVMALWYFAPDANGDDIRELAGAITQVISFFLIAVGAFRKIKNGRWSKVK